MEVDEAYSLISHAIDTGHAAHGYLIVGDLKGGCDVLADRILRKLFPNELAQIDAKSYEADLRAQGVADILKFGLAFRGKRISLASR